MEEKRREKRGSHPRLCHEGNSSCHGPSFKCLIAVEETPQRREKVSGVSRAEGEGKGRS